MSDRPARVTTTAARSGHCYSVPDPTNKGIHLPITHQPATLILFLLMTYHPVPSTRGFQSALDFPHPPLPTLCHNTGHPISLRQPIKAFPTIEVGGNETQKKGVKQPFLLFSWTVGVSSYFLIVAVVPLIPVSITNNLPSGLPPRHSRFLLLILLFLPHCEIER